MHTIISMISWQYERKFLLPFIVMPPTIIAIKPDEEIIRWLEEKHNNTVLSYTITRHRQNLV